MENTHKHTHTYTPNKIFCALRDISIFDVDNSERGRTGQIKICMYKITNSISKNLKKIPIKQGKEKRSVDVS